MSVGLGLVTIIATVWVAIGLALSMRMGRLGHDGFGWFVLGALLGPLGVVLAVDARRHDEQLDAAPVTRDVPVTHGSGPVDVLVGYDGSPESIAAIHAATEILGERLGRLTVATVVSYDGIPEEERQATRRLRTLAALVPDLACDLALLHGRPSAALTGYARERGYQLIAAGTRGTGVTRTILGSAATELARDSKVPVLLVGPAN